MDNAQDVHGGQEDRKGKGQSEHRANKIGAGERSKEDHNKTNNRRK